MTSPSGHDPSLPQGWDRLTPELIREHIRERVIERSFPTMTMARHDANRHSNRSIHSNHSYGNQLYDDHQNHHEEGSPIRHHMNNGRLHNGHPGTKIWQPHPVQMLYPTKTLVGKSNTIVRICVGGEEFVTTRETIHKLENSRLASMIDDEQCYNQELGVYFIDRSPEVFRAILDCHRYGRLHLPGHLCGFDLQEELKFWGISIEKVARCCINKITVGRTEAEVYANVEYELSNEFEDLLIESYRDQGFKKLKLNTYLFLEYPSFSTWASRWSTFFATLIIISTLNVALMSHNIGRQARAENHTVDEQFLNLVNTSKWKKLWNTDVVNSLYFFDLALVTLFTIEILVRLFTGPDKILFFKSWINVIDVITIVMFWLKFIMSLVIKHGHVVASERGKVEFAVFLFTELQFLRMFRILKLARNFTGLRVLILVLKNSRHELVTLIVFIIVGMFFFSFIIYVVEIYEQDTFQNVPVAFWWSIVTMTTVGYGDHTPEGALGMVVGALCAVAGMIISGLSIPILSANFNIYYNTLEYQMCVQEERIAQLKTLEFEIRDAKELSDIDVGSLKRRHSTSSKGSHVQANGGGAQMPNVVVDDVPVMATAMPEKGDVIYREVTKEDLNFDRSFGDNILSPEIAFKPGIRYSNRSQIGGGVDSPVFQEEINLDQFEASKHNDDVIMDDEGISSDPLNTSTAQSEEQDHLKLIDDAIRDHEKELLTNDVTDAPASDVITDDEPSSTSAAPQPPIPTISEDVFNNELQRAESLPSSEDREFLI